MDAADRTSGAPGPAPSASASALPSWSSVDRRFLLVLLGFALLTRLLWVLWVHPPGDYVWSDMGQYVRRARRLLEYGFETDQRWLAWQTYGTHYLLAGAMALLGDGESLTGAGLVWGCLSAGTVVGTYLLATRVTDRPAICLRFKPSIAC